MPTNQKYSQRLHSKRQLLKASDYFRHATKLIADVGLRYEVALPRVNLAAAEMIKMIAMLESMIDDLRENI